MIEARCAFAFLVAGDECLKDLQWDQGLKLVLVLLIVYGVENWQISNVLYQQYYIFS